MKQKFWAELKSRLCPRQNWLDDQMTNRCQCCSKQFSIFKRRHHCRFCGKIFCSNCSDLYINGTYLGLSQKYVRHCQFCKEQIEKIKQDLNRLTYMVQEQDLIREQEDDQTGSSSDEDNEYFYIKHIFGSIEKEYIYKVTEELDIEAKSLSHRILQQFIERGILSKQFAEGELISLVTKTVIENKMNILPQDLDSNEDYMDINKCVSIRTITGPPGEIIQLIKGVVLQKNLPIKGMTETFDHPQIIIVQNFLDEGVVKLKFQELLQNSKSINLILQQKIMRLNPDIIFVQKAISRQILRYFNENKICIISGIKKKQLIKIAKIGGIRNTIKNIWSIGKYQKTRFIGSIDSMSIKRFPNNEVPLIYLQKNIGVCSLVISQKTSQAQILLKKSLQLILKIIRQIQLEKYLICVDQQIWQQKTCQSGLKLFRFSKQYHKIMETLKPNKVTFYKVCLSERKIQDLDEKMQEACKMKKRSYFLDYCGEASWHQIEPYSIQDLTIGHFLLIMATNFVKKCSTCDLTHRCRYYFKDKGVQISSVSRKDQIQESQIQHEEDLTIDKMRKFLKKYKENSNIFSYFKCKICHKTVTKKAKIGKNYLKNSFHYFLNLISRESNSDFQKNDQIYRKSKFRESREECSHEVIDRFFQTSDILFRMQVFNLKTYRLDIIDLNIADSIDYLSQNTVKYIKQLIVKNIIQKQSDLFLIKNNINSYINFLEPFKYQAKTDQKLLLELQKFKKILTIFDKTSQFLNNIEAKEENKQILSTTDWTYFVREMTKIEYVIRVAVQILIVSEGKVHKRKKKINQNDLVKFQSQRQETDEYSVPDQLKIKITPPIGNSSKQYYQKQATSNITRMYFEKSDGSQGEEDNEESKLFKSQQEAKTEEISNFDKRSTRQRANSKKTFFQFQNNEKLKVFLKHMKYRRYQMKKGQILYFNLLNCKDHVSILAYALNSSEFFEQIQKKNSQLDTIKLNIVVSKQFSTSWQIKKQIDELRGDNQQEDIQKRQSYEFVAHFHHSFQQLRLSYGISFQNYVRSLACSQTWKNNSGGKSNSQFAKSQNSMLVIKTVKQEEFVQFQKFAPSYLNHIKTKNKQNKESFLTKIFGIYQLTIRGKSFKCVVMQNLFFNLENCATKVYDLKGSEVNRLASSTKGEKFTGLDMNFKIDKNFHPFLIEEKQYNQLQQSLQSDVFFLKQSEVIDYSLLVIQKDDCVRIGIIDFMRPYHIFEKIQKAYKEIKYGQIPTVVRPPLYAPRFLQAFKKYFLPNLQQFHDI